MVNIYQDNRFNVEPNSKYVLFAFSNLVYNKSYATGDQQLKFYKTNSTDDFSLNVIDSYAMGVAGNTKNLLALIDTGDIDQIRLDIRFSSGSTGTIEIGKFILFLMRIG